VEDPWGERDCPSVQKKKKRGNEEGREDEMGGQIREVSISRGVKE